MIKLRNKNSSNSSGLGNNKTHAAGTKQASRPKRLRRSMNKRSNIPANVRRVNNRTTVSKVQACFTDNQPEIRNLKDSPHWPESFEAKRKLRSSNKERKTEAEHPVHVHATHTNTKNRLHLVRDNSKSISNPYVNRHMK